MTNKEDEENLEIDQQFARDLLAGKVSEVTLVSPKHCEFCSRTLAETTSVVMVVACREGNKNEPWYLFFCDNDCRTNHEAKFTQCLAD